MGGNFVGRVLKFYNSFFFVKIGEKIVHCKLRGKMKRDKNLGSGVFPGDFVEFFLLDDGTGVIEKVLPRKNLMKRPTVANIDRVVLIFAAREPNLHPLLLNKFLVTAEWSGISEIVICANKIDLLSEKDFFLSEYEPLYKIFRVSAATGENINELKKILSSGVSVFAGPSGAGKSSLLNVLVPNLNLKVGKVSEKILRGKHTTRVSELIEFGEGFLIDTPGFSAVDLAGLDGKILRECFKEFKNFAEHCKFLNGCTHTHEPNCAVKSAVERGKILRERYESYLAILKEI